MENGILIPVEIAKFKIGYFGVEIEWSNPFESISILEISDIGGKLIYKSYMQNDSIVIFDIEKHLKNSYSVEIKNIATDEIKLYSIAY